MKMITDPRESAVLAIQACGPEAEQLSCDEQMAMMALHCGATPKKVVRATFEEWFEKPVSGARSREILASLTRQGLIEERDGWIHQTDKGFGVAVYLYLTLDDRSNEPAREAS